MYPKKSVPRFTGSLIFVIYLYQLEVGRLYAAGNKALVTGFLDLTIKDYKA
nr:hypothetical protein [uncultured Chryseobacterium sp.]